MNTQEFYAYLAGIFDGEGCFLLHKHKNKKLKIGYSWQISATITQNNPEFLKWIIKKVGYGQYVRGKNSRASFINFSSNHLRDLVPHVMPYLRIKKPQAELLLEALQIATLRRKRINLVETNNRLNEIEQEMKRLKRVNIH